MLLLSLAGNVLASELQGFQSHPDLIFPWGIVQCAATDGDVAVIVSCEGVAPRYTRLMKISFRCGVLENVQMAGSADGQLMDVFAMATLPGGGLVTLDGVSSGRFQVFTSPALRMCWIRLAVSWQCRH